MAIISKFYIVMPTYNRYEKFVRAVNSIVNQTYQNWVLFCVDDCSELDIYNNKKRYIESLHDERIQMYRLNENRGHCYARNYALERINDIDGFVKYLDDDNYEKENCLYDLYDFVSNNDCDVVSFCFEEYKDDSIKIVKPDYNNESVFDGNLDTCCISHSVKLYNNLGGWDERLLRMADDDFFFTYIEKGKYAFFDKILSAYFDTSNKDRVTNKYSNLKFLKIIASKHEHFSEKCCVVVKTKEQEQRLLNDNYIVKYFIDFDIVYSMAGKQCSYIVYYNDDISLNDVFEHFYKTKQRFFKIKNTVFAKMI